MTTPDKIGVTAAAFFLGGLGRLHQGFTIALDIDEYRRFEEHLRKLAGIPLPLRTKPLDHLEMLGEDAIFGRVDPYYISSSPRWRWPFNPFLLSLLTPVSDPVLTELRVGSLEGVLFYKALMETSADRAEFLSRLFAPARSRFHSEFHTRNVASPGTVASPWLLPFNCATSNSQSLT